MDLNCKILKEVSIYILDWIKAQPKVKEESLTDWLLYGISRKSERIHYQQFSRHQEGKVTGADWEWWFVFDDYSYMLRVQAKRYTGKEVCKMINYPKRSCKQIDKLLCDANDNMGIPVYVFFTNNELEIKCSDPECLSKEGVFIACAKKINSVKYDKTKIINCISTESIPMSYLFCLKNSSENIMRSFENSIKGLIGSESLNKFQKSECDLPEYIKEKLIIPQDQISNHYSVKKHNVSSVIMDCRINYKNTK